MLVTKEIISMWLPWIRKFFHHTKRGLPVFYGRNYFSRGFFSDSLGPVHNSCNEISYYLYDNQIEILLILIIHKIWIADKNTKRNDKKNYLSIKHYSLQ